MNTNEIVPLNEIVPKYTHKGNLYYLDKGAVEFTGKLDKEFAIFYGIGAGAYVGTNHIDNASILINLHRFCAVWR